LALRCSQHPGVRAYSALLALEYIAAVTCLRILADVERAMTLALVRSLVLTLALGAGASALVAHATGLLIVNQPWTRPALAGQATEVYMDITSTAGATLVAAASNVAATIRMRGPDRQRGEITTIALPAGRLVALAPGNYRIALLRLNRTLKLGDRVALTLTIERADGSRQEIAVNSEVRLHSPIDDELHAHRHAAH
jgi:copper(I)-binding protein